MAERRTKNDFEYDSIQVYPYWAWYFRPIGALVYAGYNGKKAGLLRLLDDPLAALNAYHQALIGMTDVERAEADLRSAESFHKCVSSDDWDPGGNTNNVGRVEKALRKAANSERAVEHARSMLADRQGTKALVEANPFDGAAWLHHYHPQLAKRQSL